MFFALFDVEAFVICRYLLCDRNESPGGSGWEFDARTRSLMMAGFGVRGERKGGRLLVICPNVLP